VQKLAIHAVAVIQKNLNHLQCLTCAAPKSSIYKAMTHRTRIYKIRTVSHKTEFTVTQATLTHKIKVWSNAP